MICMLFIRCNFFPLLDIGDRFFIAYSYLSIVHVHQLYFSSTVPNATPGTRVLIAIRYHKCRNKSHTNHFVLLRNPPSLHRSSDPSNTTTPRSPQTNKSKRHFVLAFQLFSTRLEKKSNHLVHRIALGKDSGTETGVFPPINYSS